MALDIEKCKECYYADEDCVCDKCCVDNAAFTPKRPNERICEWISVKDRLPTENEFVLVFIDSGYCCYDIAKYCFDRTWKNRAYQRAFPLCWMPLPEIPSKETEIKKENCDNSTFKRYFSFVKGL